MGASSVTGLSGVGHALSKGPGNNRNQNVPLIGPRIIAAGIANCDGSGNATVTFPTPLEGPDTNYCIMLTSSDSTCHLDGVDNNDDGNFSAFGIISDIESDTVYWTIVSVGFNPKSS